MNTPAFVGRERDLGALPLREWRSGTCRWSRLRGIGHRAGHVIAPCYNRKS